MLTFKEINTGTFQTTDGEDWWVYGKESPTVLNCTLIGHICLVTGKTKDIPCNELTLLKVYNCGTRISTKNKVGWSSNVRFIVYMHKSPFGREKIVIVKDCGGGPYFYVVDQLDFHATWLALSQLTNVSDAIGWDILSALTGTYDKGYEEGNKKMGTLFLENRLKRRKRKDAYHLEILPATK
jgi:hypothetical protein